jgi:thiol-disulfide isomerase/thioredoxin
MKTFPKTVLMLVTACILLCCSPRQYPQVIVRPASCSHDLQFAETSSLNALLDFADKMHKPVFIDFYSPWIESCKRMDTNVFTQDDLAAYFNEHFINYKINIGGPSPGPELANLYGITYYPTLIFLDGKGKVMKRHEGAATASELLSMGLYLHRAVEKEMVSVGTN